MTSIPYFPQPACKHGHPYPENRGVDSRGWAYCLICNRRWHQKCQRRRAEIRRAERGPEVDEVVLLLVRSGADVSGLTTAERRLAVEILDAWGLPASEISRRIGCSQRTVHRVRARRRAADTAWALALAELDKEDTS